MKIFKAALIGYYGFGNLGDELLLQASLNLLHEAGISDNQIIVLSNNPQETSKNFNVKSVSRWKLKTLIKTFRESECLIFGGGGIFQDSTGFKSCLWYWGVVRLAKLLGLKIIALGQSIGILNHYLSRMMTLNAFKKFDFVHVRDKYSFDFLNNNLKNTRLILGEDIVFNLAENLKLTPPENHERENFLLNLRPSNTLEKFVEIIKPEIISRKNLIGVALSADDEEILNAYKNDLAIQKIIRVKNLDDAQKIFKNAYGVAGMRLHFGILSKIFRVPCVLMAYDPKVKYFAESSNTPCMNINSKWLEPKLADNIPENINHELKIAMIEFAHYGQTQD